ncbi:MAG: MATE family efflux transporter [Candidatus Treponema excrementipullorum]|nr:MATE family efflux transporter [Spirochaetia bacterium]MDY4465678.1 MATE family efflux transporter [Candidatus Treponema excrementipullorum]
MLASFVNNDKVVSMIDGCVWKKILIFTFPILFGSFFQQLYNTVDAVVVGQFLGKAALAAVGGTTGIIFWLLISSFQGLASGVGVIVSQYVGAGDEKEIKKSIYTAVIMAVAAGLFLSVAGQLIVEKFLLLLNTPKDIYNFSLVYLRILFAGVIPNLLYSVGTSILHGMGNSKYPFYFLIISTILNIVLDIIFVTVVPLGVAGVALATILSQTVSTLLIFGYLIFGLHIFSFNRENSKISFLALKKMVYIGFPAGFQSATLAVTNLFIQSRINILGTDAVAALAAFSKVGNFYWMTLGALSISIVTYSGQNYGAGKLDRVKKGLYQGLLLDVVATVLVGLIFILFGKYLLLIFVNDREVLRISMIFLYLNVFSYIFYVPVDIISGILRSTGDVNVPTVLTFFGICFLSVLWCMFIFPLSPSVITITLCYPATWMITSVMFIIYFFFYSKLYKKMYVLPS